MSRQKKFSGRDVTEGRSDADAIEFQDHAKRAADGKVRAGDSRAGRARGESEMVREPGRGVADGIGKAQAGSKSLLDLINRTAAEVEAQERRLRDLIVDMIESKRTREALALLKNWNSKAAGDILSNLKGQGVHVAA